MFKFKELKPLEKQLLRLNIPITRTRAHVTWNEIVQRNTYRVHARIRVRILHFFSLSRNGGNSPPNKISDILIGPPALGRWGLRTCHRNTWDIRNTNSRHFYGHPWWLECRDTNIVRMISGTLVRKTGNRSIIGQNLWAFLNKDAGRWSRNCLSIFTLTKMHWTVLGSPTKS